jgi:hypothetical protein
MEVDQSNIQLIGYKKLSRTELWDAIGKQYGSRCSYRYLGYMG